MDGNELELSVHRHTFVANRSFVTFEAFLLHSKLSFRYLFKLLDLSVRAEHLPELFLFLSAYAKLIVDTKQNEKENVSIKCK